MILILSEEFFKQSFLQDKNFHHNFLEQAGKKMKHDF
jgi:hypothetical protein